MLQKYLDIILNTLLKLFQKAHLSKKQNYKIPNNTY